MHYDLTVLSIPELERLGARVSIVGLTSSSSLEREAARFVALWVNEEIQCRNPNAYSSVRQAA